MDDSELIQLLKEIRAGSSDSFERFYEEFGRRVVRYFRRTRLASSVEDLEDLTQNTLLKVWIILLTGKQRFDSVGEFEQYLLLAARSTAIDWIRRNHVGPPEVELDQDEHGKLSPQNLQGSSRIHEQMEARQEIAALLEGLSAAQRNAFLLYELEGLTYDQIAQIEGCSHDAVRSRLAEARKKIAKKLGGQHDISDT